MTTRRPEARSVVILLADDDEDDCRMTAEAFAAGRIANELHIVHDGDELLDYLHQRGAFANPEAAPRPGLILLDLNMPRVTGIEALQQIKENPALRRIPVVIMTTSQAEEDVYRSYDLGANSFISKPITFQGLIDVVQALGTYWFNVVALPDSAVKA